MNCCICGPVKNCGPYLKKVLQNIEKMGSLFDNYKIILYYDHSTDNTLQILKEYQQTNPKMMFYVNKKPISRFRTHNIAIARNYCLHFVKKNKEKFPFFIMMDLDDVNCKEVKIDILRKYLKREDWDALSFNTSPKYYDIWGLSIYPYCFSYNHFENNVKNYNIIQNYVTSLLSKLPNGKLLPCISSFNGFSIYRTNMFLKTYYDGRIRKDLIPQQNMVAHMKAANSRLVYKKYVTVDGRYEDCEHRAFHIQARQKSGAKIMISPEVLFT
jgi:glycosyltransferase involved in cell wall biosynthesis